MLWRKLCLLLVLLYCILLCVDAQSECLKEVFADLDMSSEVLEILLSPEKPFFRLSTFGNAGSTHVCVSCSTLLLLCLSLFDTWHQRSWHVGCNNPFLETLLLNWAGIDETTLLLLRLLLLLLHCCCCCCCCTQHTHNHFTALVEYIRDHPREQVPER